MRKIAVLLFALSLPTFAADTAAKHSQQQAEAIIKAAAKAHGGADAILGLTSYTLKATGTATPRMQTTTPVPPYESGTSGEDVAVDLANNRINALNETNVAGFEAHNRFVLNGSDGINQNLRAKTYTPVQPAGLSNPVFGQYFRRLPALILRNALSNPISLRYLGTDNFRGAKQDVVTFAQGDGTQLTIYVDANTHLLSKYELVLPDPLTGNDSNEVIFADYAPVNGIQTPRSWAQHLAGEPSVQRTITVTYNTPLAETLFDAKAAGFELVPPAGNRPIAPNKLAAGVYVIENFGGGNYNVLVVEFKDHVLVMEARLNTALVDDVVKRVKELVPNKPIRYAAISHHHNDHMGGVRGYINAGATIVTTPGNAALIRQYATAKLDDSLAKSNAPLKLETIANKKRVFTDGDQTVELYDIGGPHAKEMLIAYLPKQKIAFQADLFFLPYAGPVGPPQASMLAFADSLKKLGLDVQTIAAVHGRTATIRDLEQAVP
jgi:glyoxylase-like metal-dependent hydrolase (beta-lactamase superfamily II)